MLSGLAFTDERETRKERKRDDRKSRKKERKSKKQWDIEGDLANREQTATAIMALFNRVRFCAPNARWRCPPPCPSDW